MNRLLVLLPSRISNKVALDSLEINLNHVLVNNAHSLQNPSEHELFNEVCGELQEMEHGSGES